MMKDPDSYTMPLHQILLHKTKSSN